ATVRSSPASMPATTGSACPVRCRPSSPSRVPNGDIEQRRCMTVEVRWFSTLVKRTRSQLPRTIVVWEQGASPRTVFKGEGFSDVDADHVIAVINGTQVDMD